MTTIATDGISMAGDTLMSASGHVFGQVLKVHRAPDDRIYGCCGSSADCQKFERWMRSGQDYPKQHESFAALILNRDGTIDWIDEDGELVRVVAPAAIGSGHHYAIGAMGAGASPEQALAIAMRFDRNTGGEITVEHIAVTKLTAMAHA